MNHRLLSRVLYLVIFSSCIIGCRSSFDPATVPAENWFSQRKSSRSPKVSKPEQVELAGRVHHSVLDKSNGANTRLIIDIAEQEAYLIVDGKIAVTTPVSTARPGKHTPRGTFYITERVRSGKISTIYKVAMPYWQRLGDSAIGVHAGYVPGYPASAGCIRLPYDMARVIFDNTKTGTKVSIYSDWTGN